MERLSYFWNEAGTPAGIGTALAGSGTFTGVWRGPGVQAGQGISGLNYFNASFFADQAGNAYIDLSPDGTHFYTVTGAALSASTPLILTVPLLSNFVRARLVNGATPQTILWVNTSLTGA